MERTFERKSFAPIRVGEELDVKIEAVGAKGDGIAKVKGFVIFVPNTKQGDEVKVKVTKVLRKVSFGEVVGSEGANSSAQESNNNSNEDNSEEDELKEDEEESEEEY